MIFRKVALERLSSPEQLDQLLQVTRPTGWLALAAFGALIGAAFVWGFFGSIPTEASGDGMLIRSGGVSAVVAAASGQVEALTVSTGQLVEKGEVVARMRQDPLLRQIKDARLKESDLEHTFAELLHSSDEQKQLRRRDIEQERIKLEHNIAALGKDVELTGERVAAQEGLLRDGLITRQTLLASKQELNGKRDQLASQRLEWSGLELKRLEADQQLDQQLTARRGEIRDLELQLRELGAKLREDAVVVSPFAGRVVELMVDRGDVVTPGTPLVNVEMLSRELIAVLFVPASAGKRVQPGMVVRVSPSTVKKEEFGSILGRVQRAAPFPSTARGMQRLLGNEALVAKLMTEGPPLQVDVTLIRDPSTPTGYKWSSSHGPNVKLSSGTLASGSVVVKQEHPIGLLLPNLREKLGV
ncbi:MAG TPA: NHLP bacteriocin system secretion protein [Thermoanaerobaculia bacterium]